MTANFVNTPPVISEAYLTTFLAIGIPVIGAAIYKKRDWLYKKHKGYEHGSTGLSRFQSGILTGVHVVSYTHA
jgi:hypothetical protein